jgi:NAD(P)-dependent dehydrogenase (short-subunit alcohol dehydrogenase family)
VLVTGGTAGIGKAVVNRLLKGGDRVITTTRNTTAGDLHQDREPVFIQAELSTVAGCTNVVNEANSCFDDIDILVSVVGASSASSGGFAALSDEEGQKELNINLLAAVRLDRGLLPGMIKQGFGVIIHVPSIHYMKRHYLDNLSSSI